MGGLAAKRCLTGAARERTLAAMSGGMKRRHWMDGPWVWLAYLPFYAIPWLWHSPTGAELLAAAIGIAVFLPAYLVGHRQHGARLIAAALLILLVGILLAQWGGSWTVFAIYAGALAGTLRPPRHAGLLVGAIVAATTLTGVVSAQPLLWWLPGAMLVAMTGIGTISREAVLERNDLLEAAQDEVRGLAATAERERIARDLHDVVGRSLTLIALKADLAARLLPSDGAAANDEVRAVAALAREGLADVRAALAGLSGGSLARETAAAEDALRTAGLHVEMRGDAAGLPPGAGSVLAMALREAVTNVIRHADARQCRVTVESDHDRLRLMIEDDGRGGRFREGAGLTGMRQRLVAAGGTLAIEPQAPGTRLVATVPAA